MRRILLKGTKNMRDLGGYSIDLKNTTKFNAFIRSDNIVEVDNEEINYLRELGITTVIDFRKKEEIERKPNVLSKYFDYYNINLLGDKAPENEHDVAIGYINIISNIETMHEVFAIMSFIDGGIIYNCTAGKDRTGVVSMLLLMLAGVNETDIISDYIVSYNNIKEMVRKIHFDNPDLPAFLGTSKLECMEETLNLFKEKFGTIDNYFDYIGISVEQRNIIKTKLINQDV